jgi:hypothetical protein
MATNILDWQWLKYSTPKKMDSHCITKVNIITTHFPKSHHLTTEQEKKTQQCISQHCETFYSLPSQKRCRTRTSFTNVILQKYISSPIRSLQSDVPRHPSPSAATVRFRCISPSAAPMARPRAPLAWRRGGATLPPLDHACRESSGARATAAPTTPGAASPHELDAIAPPHSSPSRCASCWSSTILFPVIVLASLPGRRGPPGDSEFLPEEWEGTSCYNYLVLN